MTTGETLVCAPPNRRGLYVVFPQIGQAFVFVLSTGTFLVVNLFVGETPGLSGLTGTVHRVRAASSDAVAGLPARIPWRQTRRLLE